MLLSLLRRSNRDLFTSDKHGSFCRRREQSAKGYRETENPSAARRLFRVRLRCASSVGASTQGQRPDEIFRVQTDESRVLTPKGLRQ